METTDARWPDIVEAVKSKPIREVADTFGLRVGELTVALMRAKVERAPVAAAESKEPRRRTVRTPRKKKGGVQPTVVNGLSVRPGTRDADLAAVRDRLGQEPDSTIGAELGVSARTVAAFRRSHGIKGRVGRGPGRASSDGLPPEKKGGARRGKTSRIDPYVHMLGTVPDREVAELAGLTTNAVAAFRRRRGIDAHRASAASAPDAATSVVTATAPLSDVAPPERRAAAPAGQGVYRVTRTSGADAFVLADSLVQAAQQVQAHGDVVGVAFAGMLLV